MTARPPGTIRRFYRCRSFVPPVTAINAKRSPSTGLPRLLIVSLALVLGLAHQDRTRRRDHIGEERDPERILVDQTGFGSKHDPMNKIEGWMNVLPQSNYYAVIYADPPWTFATYSRKGKGRSAEAHYDCMSLTEIKALPVAEWAADDCVLLLWTTDPLLPTAFEVIGSWGFTYKTVGFYWAKLNKSASKPVCDDRSFFTGLGFWTRANPEICLLATRGHPHRRSANVKKLIVSPRREHSRKPDEAYRRIEALCQGPYLEMFARSAQPGWDAWSQKGLTANAIEPRRWASDSFPGAQSAAEVNTG